MAFSPLLDSLFYFCLLLPPRDYKKNATKATRSQSALYCKLLPVLLPAHDTFSYMTNREKREKRKTYTEKKLEKNAKKDKMAVLWQN